MNVFFIIVILIVVFVIFFNVYLLKLVKRKKYVQKFTPQVNIGAENKEDCEFKNIPCFENADCFRNCQNRSNKCQKGLCVPNTFLDISEHDSHCNLKKGMLDFIVGDGSLGTYRVICLPVEPLAKSSYENYMCLNNQEYFDSIDYTHEFPSIEACEKFCKTPLYVPPTITRRPHVTCENENNFLFGKLSQN